MFSSIIAAVVLFNICHMQMCVTGTPNEVYYVKSDDIQHYPCPSGSTVKCKSLAEYLSNQNMYFNSNRVFMFLCGTHNLTGVLEVRDLHNIFLNGSTRCEVNGEDTSVIQCNRKVPSGITFANSTKVHIHNIKMVDCWAPIGSALSTKHFNFSDREHMQVVPSKPDHVLSFQQEEIQICPANMKRSAFPGQIFNISVLASNYNGTAIPTLIEASLSFKSSEFAQIIGEKEMLIFSNNCTNFSLSYKLNSDNTTTSAIEVVLSQYPDQKYATANVSIALQSCPWGFQLNNGTCECANYNVHTQGYMECDLTTGSVQKQSWIWIGCSRQGNESCQNKVMVGMKTKNNNNDTFVTAEDIDRQCKEGRTGLGCGSCLGNYSVVLGTDKCMKCSDSYLGLVPLYMLAVILLILFLMAFNVTITNGYLNSFIFYVNCIYINRNEFFPTFHKYEVTRLMITWLNLDLGIEVCLFNGMTMIHTTWLQVGYVFYMWTLQIIIIFLCRRSTRCTRLFGENVNKVLSTLILLSFVKTGRIVQNILSLNKLYVINSTSDSGLDRNMWLVDSTIQYAEGKHLPLLIVAMFLIVVLLLLTLSLLFIQFLTKLSGWRCFRWVAKLYPFFETFTGPCTPNYAFWQGLMFTFQIFVLFLLHDFKSTRISVGATGVMSLTLAILSSVFPKGVYKKRSINLFQLSLLVNLFVLCTVHYFYANGKRGTQISIPIAFLSLIIFHLVDNSKKILKRLNRWCCAVVNEQRTDQLQQWTHHITYTEVSISPEGSSEHTPLIPAQSLPPVVHFDKPRMLSGGD